MVDSKNNDDAIILSDATKFMHTLRLCQSSSNVHTAVADKTLWLKECNAFLLQRQCDADWNEHESQLVIEVLFKTIAVNIFRSIPDSLLVRDVQNSESAIPVIYSLPKSKWMHLQLSYDLLLTCIQTISLNTTTTATTTTRTAVVEQNRNKNNTHDDNGNDSDHKNESEHENGKEMQMASLSALMLSRLQNPHFMRRLCMNCSTLDANERKYLCKILNALYLTRIAKLQSILRQEMRYYLYWYLYGCDYDTSTTATQVHDKQQLQNAFVISAANANGIHCILTAFHSIVTHEISNKNNNRKQPELLIGVMTNAIIPLHQCQCSEFMIYHEILWKVTKAFLNTAPKYFHVVFRGLCKYWPCTSSPKLLIFIERVLLIINEFDANLDLLCDPKYTFVMKPLCYHLLRALQSVHFRVLDFTIELLDDEDMHLVLDAHGGKRLYGKLFMQLKRISDSYFVAATVEKCRYLMDSFMSDEIPSKYRKLFYQIKEEEINDII